MRRKLIWLRVGLMITLVWSVVACSSEEPEGPVECTGLFGTPGESTGLDEEKCNPSCDCPAETWTAPDYDAAFIEELREWTLTEVIEVPQEDPYLDEGFELPERDGYCGAVIEDFAEKTYRLETFSTLDDLEEAQARLTHQESCGLCSTLRDLAVYLEYTELTGPVRECGMQAVFSGEEAQLECIEDLGFSEGCAEIWSWNTSNTREECMDICMQYVGEPHNEPDGTLNECLACDEDKSGEVFQAVAGRTRRNSGLPSAICRPCSRLYRMSHETVVQEL